jgi:cobalamin biosynthesis protein CbiG
MSDSLWEVELPAEELSLNYQLTSETADELLDNVRKVLLEENLSEWAYDYWSSVEKTLMKKYLKIH